MFCRNLEIWTLYNRVIKSQGLQKSQRHFDGSGIPPGMRGPVAGVPVVIPGNGGMTTGYLLPNPSG